MMLPRRRQPLTIRQHLGLFSATLALPLLAALVYALHAERANARAAADAAAVQLSSLASAGVGQFIDQSRLLMQSASRDPIAVAGAGRCSPELRQLPRLRPEFAAVAVSRGSGEILCSVGAAGAVPAVAGTAWFQELRRSGRFTVATHGSGRRGVTIFALPWRERGVVRGYLTVAVDLLRYQEPFTRLGLPNHALVGIVDSSRTVQARSLEPARAVGHRFDPVPAVGRQTVTAAGGDGVRRIYAASPVPGTRWRAYAGLPTASAFAASERLARAVLVAALVAILLAASAGFVVSRRIVRPIRRLGAVASRISAGDTNARAPIVGPTEVAATATEFNAMIDRAASAEEARRTALQRLAQANKMEAIGRLAGGAAHDFNNLLLAIRGYTELALQQEARGGNREAELREVLSAAERATRLTQQLLVFARRQPSLPVPVDLGEVVVDMEKLLRRLIGEDVELVCVRPQLPVTTLADRGQLEQVILNLAINARDAMPCGGRLTIEVSELEPAATSGHPPARHVLLAVTDTGCGMDAETSARIFEPFFSTKGERGTGLGLATVHAIVSQSGGEVRVSSEPGQGTTFRVYLPRHEPTAESVPELGPAVSSPPAKRSGTILLVEDDPSVRHVVGTMLADSGLAVLSAHSGEAAIALAAAHPGPIVLLITDLVMPGLTGPETAQQIRATRPDLHVLYMSGYADDPVYRGGGTLDPDAGFIQKPFDRTDLLGAIDAILARASAR